MQTFTIQVARKKALLSDVFLLHPMENKWKIMKKNKKNKSDFPLSSEFITPTKLIMVHEHQFEKILCWVKNN